jgi:hypothetical protein
MLESGLYFELRDESFLPLSPPAVAPNGGRGLSPPLPLDLVALTNGTNTFTLSFGS